MLVGTATQTAMSLQYTQPSTPGTGSQVARRWRQLPTVRPNSSTPTKPQVSICSVMEDSAMPSTPIPKTSRPAIGPTPLDSTWAASTGESFMPS